METLNPDEETKLLQQLRFPKKYQILSTNLEPVNPTPILQWKARRNHLAAVLMLDAGIRVGELVQLRRYDLYFAQLPVKTLILRKEIAKRRHERHIPLTARTTAALLDFYYDPRLVEDWPLTQPIIANSPIGHALTTRTIERIIEAAAMFALGRPIHPHLLRHTYGTKLMKVTDIRTVQELLGHKNVSTTQMYTHVNAEDKRRAVDQLDNGSTPPNLGDPGPSATSSP